MSDRALRPFRWLATDVDRRRGANSDLELLSVSIHRGVIPRAELTDQEPRAEDLSNYKVCLPGEIVVNRMRAFQGALGLSPLTGIVSPDFAVLRPSSDVDGRYLAYLMRSKWFVGEMIQRLRGIGTPTLGSVRTPRVNVDDLRDITVVIPPLREQRRIADFLDDQVTRIDNIIAARRAQVSALAELHRAELDDQVMVEPVPRSRLAHFAVVQSGITVDGGRDEQGTDAVPYLRVANVQAGSLDLSEVKTISTTPEQRVRHALRFGDVLMTEGGDLDKLGRGTVWREEIPGAIHQNHVFAVRVDPQTLLPEYLAYVTASSEARSYFESTGNRTTNLASTSASKVLDLPVPVRDLGAQRVLVNRVQEHENLTQAVSSVLERSANCLQELKASLISSAVSGEFDTSTASGVAVPV